MEVIKPELKIDPLDDDNCGKCKKIHEQGLIILCMVFDTTLMGWRDWVENDFMVSGRPDVCKRAKI